AAIASWTSSVSAAAISKFAFWLTENPLTITRTRYFPGRSEGNTYLPDWSVLDRCSPLGPRSCTRAPGTTAPEGSVTTPRRLAGGVCAEAHARDKARATIPLSFFISSFLLGSGNHPWNVHPAEAARHAAAHHRRPCAHAWRPRRPPLAT